MGGYFVAGCIYQNHKGEEFFDLLCPRLGEPPYIMVSSLISFFKLMRQNAHLYRVEMDYTLTLVAPSPEAQRWGVKAPGKVTPEENLLEKLRAVIEHI
jgi:hypothetical protein